MSAGPEESPWCSVVIGTRGRGDKIVPLLESLQRSDFEDFVVIIVDQSDDDRTEQAVEPFLDDRRFSYFHVEGKGVSIARNFAVSQTSAPMIAVTDDDCIVRPDWLSTMMAPFRRDDRLGIMFCDVEPVDPPPGQRGHTPQIAFGELRTMTSVDEAWRVSRSGFCLGAGMAVRRRTFDELGGFDAEIGPGRRFGSGEENDLSWRALIAGWSVRLDPSTAVLHDGFRDLDAFRELVNRDFYGVGATLSKYIRLRRWGAVALGMSWMWRFGLVDPVKQVLSGTRPSGFRRPLKLMQGLVDGLRCPIEKATLKFAG